jgi:hypothetical protein
VGAPIRNESNSILLGALAASLVTAAFTFSILNLVTSAIYTVLAAVIGFGLTGTICSKSAEQVLTRELSVTDLSSVGQLPGKPPLSFWDFLAVGVLLASCVAVYAIPSMGPSLIWADWLAIPVANYLRIAAGVLLTTLVPGYFLLRVLDPSRQFKGLETLVLAYLLSLLIVPLVTMLGSAAGLAPIGFEVPLVVSLNLSLLLVFVAAHFLRSVQGSQRAESLERPGFRGFLASKDRAEFYLATALAGVLGLVILLSYRVFLIPPYIVADQWPHHAVARLYEAYGNQVFTTGLMPYSAFNSYPRWFHIYLGSLFAISGAPSTNTYAFIDFTNIFGLLALYLLAVSLFRKGNKAIAAVALALALFSGFGWTYDLWLRNIGAYSGNLLMQFDQASISAFDVLFANTYFGSDHPTLTSGLQVMALPGILMLLFLTNRGDLRDWTRHALIGLLMALTFLGHVAEGGMFVAILLFAIIVSGRIEGASKVALATLSGIGITGAVGLVLPDRYYVSLGAFYVALALAAVSVIVAYARQRLSGKISSFHPQRVRLAVALSIAGIAAWVALFLLWRLTGYNTYTVWWDCPSCTSTVPPYMYPTRFGVLGLLAIPGVVFAGLVWRERIRGLGSIYGFAAVALFLGRLWMVPQLFKFAGIEEFRWNKYLALALVLPTALFVWNVLRHVSKSGRSRNLVLAGFLIAVMVSFGLASTMLYGEFTTVTYVTSKPPTPGLPYQTPGFGLINSHQLSPEELAAIQYLADALRPGEVVATIGYLAWVPGGYPYSKVTLIGGLLRNQTFSLDTLYGLMNKSEVYNRLTEAHVHFIYLTVDDLNVLADHPLVYEAITELPVLFTNSQVTIYGLG